MTNQSRDLKLDQKLFLLLGLGIAICFIYNSCNLFSDNEKPLEPAAINYFNFNNIYAFSDRADELGLEIKDHLVLKNSVPYSGEISWEEPNLSWQVEVREGLLNGSLREYFGNKQLKTEKHFLNGYEKGIQKGFHMNGAFSYEYQASKGNVIGCKSEYYDNGVQSHEYCFEKGIRVSTKIWTRDRKIIANNVFKKGRHYGLLGSKNCLTVYDQSKENFKE